MTTMNYRDLGLFIRKHRERTNPENAGFRSAGRRRTPGLRREELAQLCGVSPTWITWLEQGREVKASVAMLERLSDALALTQAERRYLFILAGKLDEEGEGEKTEGALLQCVEFVTTPAYILDRKWNVLSWNKEALKLFEGWLDKEDAPNLLRFTFLSPFARELIENWEERAKRLAAEFRADCGRHADEADLKELIAELSAKSPFFSKCWDEYEVTAREGGLRIFIRGGLRLSYLQTTFYPALRRDLKLVLLLPV